MDRCSARRLHRSTGDLRPERRPLGRGPFLANLGFAALFGGGTLAEARTRFEEARPLLYGLGSFGTLVVTVLAPLSTIVLKQGDLRAAERYAMEAVELSSGTAWETSALVVHGEALTARGDLASADAATTRALMVALNAGLENCFRMALRDLAATTAVRGTLEGAAVLLGAARRNLPAYGLDPEIWAPIEQRCREGLGRDRFERLSDEGSDWTTTRRSTGCTPQWPCQVAARHPTRDDRENRGAPGGRRARRKSTIDRRGLGGRP